jgi:hypothetical protein
MHGSRAEYRNERGALMVAGLARVFLFATRKSLPLATRAIRETVGHEHIGFPVARGRRPYAKLWIAGVTFDGEPQDPSWGARMVGLKDPDGDNLQFRTVA